jgi:hypothetical protein
MAVINDPTTAANVARVGAVDTASDQSAQHVSIRPLPYGGLGHYAMRYRAVLASTQAATSRLLELRNTGANKIVITKLVIRVMQVAAGTAQENSIDVYRATGFTAVDTVNTTTPVPSVKRTGMGASPGNVNIRGVTLAGAAAGMTGGTLTLDSEPIATCPFLVNTAIPTTANAIWGPYDLIEKSPNAYPLVLAQNEGIVLVNRVLNVTSYGCAFFVEMEYAEVANF